MQLYSCLNCGIVLTEGEDTRIKRVSTRGFDGGTVMAKAVDVCPGCDKRNQRVQEIET